MKGYLSPSADAAQHRRRMSREQISRAVEAVTPIKSRLLDELRRLETAAGNGLNTHRAAKGLARIIGELESWQGRNA